MTTKDTKPLQIALYGLDERSSKTMEMFLQKSCKGVGVVVEPVDAQIDIINADFPTAKDILDERREASPDRPLILMSLEHLRMEGIIYLKKPVETEALIAALDQARILLEEQAMKLNEPVEAKTIPNANDIELAKTDNGHSDPATIVTENNEKKHDLEEPKKIIKHQSAKQYNEGGFATFLGFIPEINFEDKDQIVKASFNPKNHFQGYVKSAFLVARKKGRILQLNSNWKSLLIFPQSDEVWLDADDKQLRAFAGLSFAKISGDSMSLVPVNDKTARSGDELEKFQSMDGFIWKLAIWASKGRYPVNINIQQPVFLKHWPNMTRLVVTPHALRISALLIKGPRTLLNVAEVLKIKPQYVFVFVSACHAIELLGQAKRQAEDLIAPTEIKPARVSGLFRKILVKLRPAISSEN